VTSIRASSVVVSSSQSVRVRVRACVHWSVGVFGTFLVSLLVRFYCSFDSRSRSELWTTARDSLGGGLDGLRCVPCLWFVASHVKSYSTVQPCALRLAVVNALRLHVHYHALTVRVSLARILSGHHVAGEVDAHLRS
jgi:hypothetical protein